MSKSVQTLSRAAQGARPSTWASPGSSDRGERHKRDLDPYSQWVEYADSAACLQSRPYSTYIDYFDPVISFETELDLARSLGETMSVNAIAKSIHQGRTPGADGRASGPLRKKVEQALLSNRGTAVEERSERGARRWVRTGSFVGPPDATDERVEHDF